MIFRNRPLARLGAAALLASGALSALGVPAYAAGTETDLSLDVVGTRVAADAEAKVAFVKITNHGTNTPSQLAIRADVSKLDWDKVAAFPALDDGSCKLEGTEAKPTSWTCPVIDEQLPGPGETLEYPVILLKAPDLEGTYVAPVSFTLVSADDTNPANDTKDAKIEFSNENGPDLMVIAGDVKQAVKVEGDKITIAGDLHAGDTAQLRYIVFNQGDTATSGLKLTVKLPKGVTFTEVEDDCEYDEAKTSAVCTYEAMPFVPVDEDTSNTDKVYSGGGFYNLLTVADDVKAGALTGGSVTAEPLVAAAETATKSHEIKVLPRNVTGMQAKDIDATDNTDGYAVIVAAKGGSGGGDGEDGGLPVTGAKAGLIGGVGAAVLAAGGALFLAARRRRVVLVTPGDERPTA